MSNELLESIGDLLQSGGWVLGLVAGFLAAFRKSIALAVAFGVIGLLLVAGNVCIELVTYVEPTGKLNYIHDPWMTLGGVTQLSLVMYPSFAAIMVFTGRHYRGLYQRLTANA